MKLNKYIAIMLAGATLASCANFEEINTNPDATTRTTSSLLATGAIMGIMKPSNGKPFLTNQMLTKHIGWGGEGKEGAQYNSFGSESFDGYTQLKNYQLMVELATPEYKSAYEALALFLKTYKLYNYTINVGDIPYEGILQGKEGNLTPAYNTQKEVFLFLLANLDRAHELFQTAKNFNGDPIFKGNIKKWVKINTALQLRMLINLSKKENDTDLSIKRRFAEIAARPNALMSSNEDNLQLVFSEKAGQIYPLNISNNPHSAYPVMTTTVMNILQANKDYRIFYYADPSTAKLKEGLTPSDWEAYYGVDPSLPIETFNAYYNNGDFCTLNRRYITYTSGEPYIQFGYAEQNFILAEGALRGWITGNASAYYQAGIKASMEFVKNSTPNDAMYHHERLITNETIDQTLANPTIQLTNNFEDDLKKIMEQKYVAGFLQLPYQSYYDYRRTGYPTFPINPETNNNNNAPHKMPMRWTYPSSEFSYNKANVEAALQKQFGTTADDINEVMWILQ